MKYDAKSLGPHWPRYIDFSKPERIYWNLHEKCWTIQWYVRGKGYRVQGHMPYGWADRVTFKVYEAGRQRVLREQRKNVHAFAEVHGAIYPHSGGRRGEGHRTWEAMVIRYNPYEGPHFATPGGTWLKGANVVHFTDDGRLLADYKAMHHVEKGASAPLSTLGETR